MLVSFGNIDLIGYVLEVYEVLSEGCPKPFQTVGIIVNEPSPRGDNLRIVAKSRNGNLWVVKSNVF